MLSNLKRTFVKPLVISAALGLSLGALQGCQNLANLQSQDSSAALMDTTSLVKNMLGQSIEQGAAQLMQSEQTPAGQEQALATNIPLPESLNKIAAYARKLGFGSYVDKVETSINETSDKAVPVAKGVFLEAAKEMNITDAGQILLGGETAATDFFKAKSEVKLQEKMLPIIEQASAEAGLGKDYQSLLDKVTLGAKLLGMNVPEQLDLNKYISGQTSELIFKQMAEQEVQIRQDPKGEAQKLLQKAIALYTQRQS